MRVTGRDPEALEMRTTYSLKSAHLRKAEEKQKGVPVSLSTWRQERWAGMACKCLRLKS